MAQTQLQLISPFLHWLLIHEDNYWVFKHLHAIISTLLIINLQWVYKIYFAVLKEIYNNVVPHWSAVLISCNHSMTRLIYFTKNGSNSFCIWTLYMFLSLHSYLQLRIILSSSVAWCRAGMNELSHAGPYK